MPLDYQLTSCPRRDHFVQRVENIKGWFSQMERCWQKNTWLIKTTQPSQKWEPKLVTTELTHGVMFWHKTTFLIKTTPLFKTNVFANHVNIELKINVFFGWAWFTNNDVFNTKNAPPPNPRMQNRYEDPLKTHYTVGKKKNSNQFSLTIKISQQNVGEKKSENYWHYRTNINHWLCVASTLK